MGRPSDFTPEIANEVCERLAKGEPLASICRDEHMPAVRTVSDWKSAHSTFSADFAHAREAGFDQIALDCLEIADETGNDTKLVGAKGEEHEVANTEWISRSKLRVETRLKLLAKWDPKRYGDKTILAGDEDSPLQMVTRIELVAPDLPDFVSDDDDGA